MAPLERCICRLSTRWRQTLIKELPFYEIWADRTDIEAGVSYVNKLRDTGHH
jgi:hypothetical protein